MRNGNLSGPDFVLLSLVYLHFLLFSCFDIFLFFERFHTEIRVLTGKTLIIILKLVGQYEVCFCFLNLNNFPNSNVIVLSRKCLYINLI